MNISESVNYYFEIPKLDDVIENKIRAFSQLPLGWYYGEGGPITDEVINVSLELFRYARELMFFEFEPFPGANGELLLSIYKGDYTLDLMVEPDLSITATLERGKEEVYDDEGLSVAEAKRRIHDLRKQIWMQSDSFTPGTTVPNLVDSRASRSSHLVTAQAFQSSIVNASSTLTSQYVVI